VVAAAIMPAIVHVLVSLELAVPVVAMVGWRVHDARLRDVHGLCYSVCRLRRVRGPRRVRVRRWVCTVSWRRVRIRRMRRWIRLLRRVRLLRRIRWLLLRRVRWLRRIRWLLRRVRRMLLRRIGTRLLVLLRRVRLLLRRRIRLRWLLRRVATRLLRGVGTRLLRRIRAWGWRRLWILVVVLHRCECRARGRVMTERGGKNEEEEGRLYRACVIRRSYG
jgi:hypothetical protein